MTFFWNADSVRVVSSSSGSGQSHTEQIIIIFLHFGSHVFTALWKARARMWYIKCPFNPARPIEGLGERCRGPGRSRGGDSAIYNVL